MARLGIEKYNSNFSKYLNPLIDSKLITYQDASLAGLGHIYYLTKKGASLISGIDSRIVDSVFYLRKKPTLDSNIFHRTYSIDCQIELKLSCQKNNDEILFYEKDVDNSYKNLERKTRISLSPSEHLEPDAVFKLNTAQGVKLYCLEFEYQNSIKKSLSKIMYYIKATNMKAVSKKYNHEKGHRTLFVYYDASLLSSIKNQLLKQEITLGSWFLFKSFNDVQPTYSKENSAFIFSKEKDFINDWVTLENRVLKLY